MAWRARVGVIYPADGLLDEELWRLVPEGVAPFITREDTPYEGVADLSYVNRIAENPGIEAAARSLRMVKPDVLAFLCTAGSFVKGVGGDLEIIRRIEQAGGAPATTTSTALIKALHALKLGKLAVATPYVDQINQRLVAFLEGHGFKVVNLEGMRFRDPWDIGQVSNGEVYRLARRADRPEAECLFISCTGFPTLDILEPLEEDLGKPVLSANQVTMWDALRIAGVSARVPGAGRLYLEWG